MGKSYRVTLILFAAIAVALLTLSQLVDWFTLSANLSGVEGLSEEVPRRVSIDIGLASVRSCVDGRCETVAIAQLARDSSFAESARITLWGARVVIALVALLVTVRLVKRLSIMPLAVVGYLVALVTLGAGVVTAFVVGVPGSATGRGASIAFTRSWSPTFMLVGCLLALLAIWFTRMPDDEDELARVDVRPRSPSLQPPLGDARPRSPSLQPVGLDPRPRTPSSANRGTVEAVGQQFFVPGRPRTPSRLPSSIPLDDAPADLERSPAADLHARVTGGRPHRPTGGVIEVDRRPNSPSRPPPAGEVRPRSPTGGVIEVDRRRSPTGGVIEVDSRPPSLAVSRAKTPSSAPLPSLADVMIGLRGQVRFAVLTVEITPSGLDAMREDGGRFHVGWHEVVGVVVRRLPQTAPHRGIPFIDVVSTPGSTLRILPWTQIGGEELGGAPEDRARAFVELLQMRSPSAALDGPTREFVEGAGPPAQLPDVAALTNHDRRIG